MENYKGKCLGKCQILEKLGEGSGGTVYKARHLLLDKIVAMKLLSPKNLGNEEEQEYIQRFLREGRAIAKLDHPNIISISDVGQDQGVYYIVMQYINGKTLREIIEQNGKLAVEQALVITKEIAKGLYAIHSQGIIHRDIKPDNIMISSDGEIKITDFGVAKHLHEDLSLTKTGTTQGTPLYISPEQAMGQKKIDGRTDLYSLGIVFYHSLTGEPPYKAENAFLVFQQHVSGPIPSIQEKLPKISRTVDAMFQKLVAKKPEDRFATAQDLVEQIERIEKLQAFKPVRKTTRQIKSLPTMNKSRIEINYSEGKREGTQLPSLMTPHRIESTPPANKSTSYTALPSLTPLRPEDIGPGSDENFLSQLPPLTPPKTEARKNIFPPPTPPMAASKLPSQTERKALPRDLKKYNISGQRIDEETAPLTPAHTKETARRIYKPKGRNQFGTGHETPPDVITEENFEALLDESPEQTLEIIADENEPQHDVSFPAAPVYSKPITVKPSLKKPARIQSLHAFEETAIIDDSAQNWRPKKRKRRSLRWLLLLGLFIASVFAAKYLTKCYRTVASPTPTPAPTSNSKSATTLRLYLQNNEYAKARQYLEQHHTKLHPKELARWTQLIAKANERYISRILGTSGWFGEKMPAGMVRASSRGSYLWQKDQSLMVYIPAGNFIRGAMDKRADEKPQRSIQIAAFYIDKYELTTRQYQIFCSRTGYPPPKNLYSSDQPIVGISWLDAKNYARWAKKRLPSEAEWEKAARGGLTIPDWQNKMLPIAMINNPHPARIYPWGNASLGGPGSYRCNFCQAGRVLDKFEHASVVGKFPGGDSPYFCSDMAGNVLEWCQDFYQAGYYRISPSKNPQGPKQSTNDAKICRGGAFDSLKHDIYATRRWSYQALLKYDNLGVRLAR